MSHETQAARWIGFRQPILRVALAKQGKTFNTTYEAHEAAGIGQVWEEDEFWIELSWRIDPDGALGIRKHFESPFGTGEKLTVHEYYRWIFENSVPGLAGTDGVRGVVSASGKPIGVKVGDAVVAGFPTPSRKLELWSGTMAE